MKNGEECITLQWLLKEKITDNEKNIKATLCATGFEEKQYFHTNSPICWKEGLRRLCCTIASNEWSLNSLDVKSAFLQGILIERIVYMPPPKEATANKI